MKVKPVIQQFFASSIKLRQMIFSRLFLIFHLLILTQTGAVHAMSQEKTCMKSLLPYEDQISSVSQLGGIWTLFESQRNIRGDSVVGLKLDQKLNQLLFTLKYVCESLNGIPYSELADYVNRFLQEKTELEIRKELKIHGKSKAEVDIWFKYTYFFNKHKDRKLDQESVKGTIKNSGIYFDRYVAFSKQLQSGSPERIIQKARKIIEDIDSFLQSDGNLKTASFENAQAPYWDIDENYGGS